jgi:hypothetical protein
MRSIRRAGPLALVALSLGSLAATAPALGATFTLNLAGPASGVSGQPFLLTASGTDPTDQGALYLEVDAIPSSVTRTCPSGYLDGSQLASSTGGSFVAFDQRENFDSSGNFSMPLGYTPRSAGGVLFCGYTDDGATDTLATASTLVSVAAPPSGSGPSPTPSPSPTPTPTPTPSPAPQQLAKPVNLVAPGLSRSGTHLACSKGTWSNNPTRFTYGWIVGGRVKRGAHGTKLAVTRGLRSHRVRCTVTATNSAGSATALSRQLTITAKSK